MIDTHLGRRAFIRRASAMGVLMSAGIGQAAASEDVDLHFPGPPSSRKITKAFPQKGEMILQRTRPPLLETPFSVFDEGVFTPNDRFFVRWHLGNIPDSIDVDTFRLSVRGLVNKEMSLTLKELMAMPRIEIAAVNQCSGNSRGYFQPRVAGGQWGHGAMGNAKWTGVRLRDVLDRAGVKPGAVEVRFNGLETGVMDTTPDFIKSLSIDHARDGDVMIAFLMNGEPLPLLNGFPLRLVVPGWYSTYWTKMLNSIEVIDKPDDNFWMKTAYKIPDTPGASVKPGEKGFKTVPINKMVPRSFITNLAAGAKLTRGAKTKLRGIAFGGNCGVATVDVSIDGGASWAKAVLGEDEGKYSFRRWDAAFTAGSAGAQTLLVRAKNTEGLVQPDKPTWNSGGYMLNVIEQTPITIA